MQYYEERAQKGVSLPVRILSMEPLLIFAITNSEEDRRWIYARELSKIQAQIKRSTKKCKKNQKNDSETLSIHKPPKLVGYKFLLISK